MFFGIIAILNLWKDWLERTKVMRYINNSRMRIIEQELGMWKNRMIPIVDGNTSKIYVPPEVAMEINEILKLGKTKPGTYCLKCIVNVTIVLWFIAFIVSSIVILH